MYLSKNYKNRYYPLQFIRLKTVEDIPRTPDAIYEQSYMQTQKIEPIFLQTSQSSA